MRLSPAELQIISQIMHQEDAEAEVYLYGSRVDDNAKGGGIDLLVLSHKIDWPNCTRDSGSVRSISPFTQTATAHLQRLPSSQGCAYDE